MVHVLQLGFRGMKGVWRWVQLVGFEALVRESDLERLVIFLAVESCQLPHDVNADGSSMLTEGTDSFSACEDAASVVTARLDKRAGSVCLDGTRHRVLAVRQASIMRGAG